MSAATVLPNDLGIPGFAGSVMHRGDPPALYSVHPNTEGGGIDTRHVTDDVPHYMTPGGNSWRDRGGLLTPDAVEGHVLKPPKTETRFSQILPGGSLGDQLDTVYGDRSILNYFTQRTFENMNMIGEKGLYDGNNPIADNPFSSRGAYYTRRTWGVGGDNIRAYRHVPVRKNSDRLNVYYDPDGGPAVLMTGPTQALETGAVNQKPPSIGLVRTPTNAYVKEYYRPPQPIEAVEGQLGNYPVLQELKYTNRASTLRPWAAPAGAVDGQLEGKRRLNQYVKPKNIVQFGKHGIPSAFEQYAGAQDSNFVQLRPDNKEHIVLAPTAKNIPIPGDANGAYGYNTLFERTRPLARRSLKSLTMLPWQSAPCKGTDGNAGAQFGYRPFHVYLRTTQRELTQTGNLQFPINPDMSQSSSGAAAQRQLISPFSSRQPRKTTILSMVDPEILRPYESNPYTHKLRTTEAGGYPTTFKRFLLNGKLNPNGGILAAKS